jgi:hypothetical protein
VIGMRARSGDIRRTSRVSAALSPTHVRPHYGAAAVAGVIAGTVMSMAMMLVAILRGQSVWMLPNMIAAMWLGPDVATGALGLPTMVGFLTHMATSALMGVVAVPFVAGLPRWRVLLVSLAYALASYPLVFSLVLSWTNPLMYERASMMQMTWGHLVFGAVFGVSFTWLERRRDRRP